MFVEYLSRKRGSIKAWVGKLLMPVVTVVVLAGCLLPIMANAKTLFQEDFEGDLSKWTTRGSSTTVTDPLNTGRGQVLSFTRLASGGDLRGQSVSNPTGKYTLSFDYLGLAKTGSVSDDFGGFIGAIGSYGPWLAGTQANYPGDGYGGLKYHLQDTGKWTHVTFDFTGNTSIYLILEDFSGSKGVVGDAYFDNILLTDEQGADPEPSTKCDSTKHAVYSVTNNIGKLVIPFVEIPLLNLYTHQPTGELAVFSGELKQVGSSMDFGLVSSKLKLIFLTTTTDPCHAVYDETQKTLHVPFVDVGNEVYDVKFQHLKDIPLELGVFHLESYDLVE